MTNRLREARENDNRRLWELAALASVSASTLSAIERYDYKPRASTMAKIASALNLQTEDIWTMENDHGTRESDEAATP